MDGTSAGFISSTCSSGRPNITDTNQLPAREIKKDISTSENMISATNKKPLQLVKSEKSTKI